jgi:glycosyltransferase involved in cell wall biosynthesis
VPRHRVPGLLAACDALLVMLRDDPLFGVTIPSKVYEYMAAGKPVLCSVAGECAALVAAAGAGVAVAPSNGLALAEAIRQLSCDPDTARALGESGASWVRAQCDRSSVMVAYRDVLESVTDESPRGISMPEEPNSQVPAFYPARGPGVSRP